MPSMLSPPRQCYVYVENDALFHEDLIITKSHILIKGVRSVVSVPQYTHLEAVESRLRLGLSSG